ncbi:glycosyltransferase [Pelagicoccus sp. SDUM812002]|nr:glycosyltransferase [Pelagicoccus sp. SDUM812002]
MALHIDNRKETLASAFPSIPATLNVLFVNYGDLRSNSLNHIGPYANELSALGHSCTVILDGEKCATELQSHSPLFAHYTHGEMAAGIELFGDAKPADIIHAWTPREIVRKSVQNYLSHHPAARLVVHLEDNEEEILESAYQSPIEILQKKCLSFPDSDWNQLLSHPLLYREFLSQADGITLLRPSLKKLIPVPKFCREISPIVQTDPPLASEKAKALREKLQIKENEYVIAFPGGVTSSNRSDIRDLFLAVKIINDRGTPCRLIKTGPSCPDLRGSFSFPLEEICIDLGYVAKKDVRALLQMADILVQPGKRNAFNEDRFPCKIPEFLASGTPCIIPSMYAPSGYSGPTFCSYLEESSPSEIAERAMELFSDHKARESLSAAASHYAEETFSPSPNVRNLIEFYQEIKDSDASSRKPELYAPSKADNSDPRTMEEIATLKQQLSNEKETSHELTRRCNEIEDQLGATLAQLAEQKDRVRRMQASFSWKATSPLRALRRRFFDKQAFLPPQQPVSKSDEEVEKDQLLPANHPSLHKEYYLFVRADKLRIQNILDSPSPIDPKEQPRISVLLPVYNVAEKWLEKCINSVLRQTYTNWELCIADDASDLPHVRKLIKRYLAKDNRIRAIFREVNGHISLATNSAFTLASGDFIALLDHDDELAPHALMRVAECILENPSAKLIYSDEDKIDENGLRHGPHFKSDWNYDLFLGCNMISHLGVYHRECFEKVGGFRKGFEGAQDWDLALRTIELINPQQIFHIPEILYHWRNIEGSTAHSLDQKGYASDAQKRAIESHLERIGVTATLESVDNIDWKVNYAIPNPSPKVCIVIPTKDRLDLLKPCIDSIIEKTIYDNYEIVIVDNDSKQPDTLSYFSNLKRLSSIRIITDKGDFNYSRINNRAIETCESDLICLLNNDTEVINSGWLRELVQHAHRKEIGVVGAKLLFPHDHVQHGGVIMGVGGIAAHAFKYLHRTDDGHIHRAHLVSGYSATTGACMMFRKATWKAVGGLDEINLPISYNDVDFCLRVGQANLRTIVTPFALLIHKESESRGSPTSDAHGSHRFQREAQFMESKWGSQIKRDPYYNPNFTCEREDFSYSYPKSTYQKQEFTCNCSS